MLVIRYWERQSQTDRIALSPFYCSILMALFQFQILHKKYRKMNISRVPEKIRVSEDATFQAETHPGGGGGRGG
jgi:hypothetical protein